ncbi:C-X-C motif chemokine 11-like [Heteronotia binoei]|uniref:C-X-C motif chemokine 11-like n=1 Tax=Heteronotia binoei TaxID=13085 RepID=UPI00292F456C|nr:C-X-C motif chemokine 11-like [Heteronotia binoei]
MIRWSFLLTLLLLLGAVPVPGMPTSRRGHCLCRRRNLVSIQFHLIAEVEYHRPSASCDQEELIVTFKSDGRKRCLNVNLGQGRKIKEAIMKKKK